MPNLNIPLTDAQRVRMNAAKATLEQKARQQLTWPEFCDLVSQDILSRFKSKP